MPKLKIKDGEATVPSAVADQESKVIPVTSLVPGTHSVLVYCRGVVNGYVAVRNCKRHGQAIAVQTAYGTADADLTQTVRVLA